jgi:tetratricopeptide (TPR) repeat protein
MVLFTIGIPKNNCLKKILLILFFTGFVKTFAQTGAEAPAPETPLLQARNYAMNKEYDKAIAIFANLYKQNKADETVYNDYLNTLILAKKYKDAEKLAEEQHNIRPQFPIPFVDMGRVYLAEGKDKKANEQFDLAVQYITGDDLLTQQIATAFINMGKDDYAIRTYERGKDIIGNPYVYAGPLAKLYAKAGNMDKAVSILTESGNIQFGGIDNTKTTLLELIGTDQKKILLTQKALVKKINEQPENVYYVDLLTWLYTQKNDWDGALIQIEALDERDKAQGRRLIDFGRMAAREKQYDIALKAYNEVTAIGKDAPFYAVAESDKLSTSMVQLENSAYIKPEILVSLEKAYDTFLTDFPKYYGTETANEYAALEAQYKNNTPKAIDILNQAIVTPNANRNFVGRSKLQLGDYYIIVGKVWDASLTYSQVDKEFKQDILGEEARFRNAKLAYYRGDFALAQWQLSILKASTSELIANDALYLSVLITENIGEDSNYVPLRRFAYADLLLFQNKDKEATALLDSIATTYPKHPLQDDILMLRANMAEKHKEFDKALSYLKQIYEQYRKDVLGDDAVYKTAEIYNNFLHQTDQAIHYYEQLILDYPGSTFVQDARKKLQQIKTQGILP